jgi:uncharacterized protein YndB with AHSA1/START domain
VKLAVQQLVVRASAEKVFELFTNPAQFGQWMAQGATLDPTPGGIVRWTHPNGDTVSGRYVELRPPRRIVFTYGWERADVGIPPGSTTVEIDLIAQPDGSTLVKLVHRGLDDHAAEAHQGGWAHYLNRMRRSAEGEDVGTDPWADRRVPSHQSQGDDARLPSETYFWALAQALLNANTVTRSTMMGLPCLRVDGRFFASFDPRTNALVVKLPAARVDQLIESGQAEPFAPAGRRFREWAAIDPSRSAVWPSFLDEALAFVAAQRTQREYPH